MMLSDAAMAHRMERRLYWPEREVVAEPVTRGYSRRHCKGIPANHRHPQSSDTSAKVHVALLYLI